MAYKLRELVTSALEKLDPKIVESAKTDSQAFATLYDFYFPKVYAFVMSRVGSREAAEDIVSDIFLRVLENIRSYEERGHGFTAWLFTVARNVIFDFYGSGRKRELLPLDEGAQIRDEGELAQPGKLAEQSELKEKVKTVMDGLPERELCILQMKFFAGLQNREIALAMNLTESNVGIILYRVLRKIKPDLNNLF
jgi:RNA polymerase sigma-70 factor (ECF subfamily)